MSLQTGETQPGPTGKPKNCNSWAEYESPNSSATSALCNGGVYKGMHYGACESRSDCIQATHLRGRSHLPIYTNPEKPMGSGVVASTPNLRDTIRRWQPMAPSVPQQQPGRPVVPQPQTMPTQLAYPVQPPVDWPYWMRTPYAGPNPTIGGVTPTFLPQDNENAFARLFKNIFQGMVGATGWHIFDFARSVDLFPSEAPDRKTGS